MENARRRALALLTANYKFLRAVAAHLFWWGELHAHFEPLLWMNENKSFAAPFGTRAAAGR
jgi:hypothetical protein